MRAREKPKGARQSCPVTLRGVGGVPDRVDTANQTSAGETRAQDRSRESPHPWGPP